MKPARRRRVAGSCGRPNAGIERAKKGVPRGGNKHVAGALGSVKNSKPPSTLLQTARTRLAKRLARVITHVEGRGWEKNFPAIGQVAMRASIAHRALPGSVFVRPCVVRPYVLCICEMAIGKLSASRVHGTVGSRPSPQCAAPDGGDRIAQYWDEEARAYLETPSGPVGPTEVPDPTKDREEAFCNIARKAGWRGNRLHPLCR